MHSADEVRSYLGSRVVLLKLIFRELVAKIKVINAPGCAPLQEALITQIERYFYGADSRKHFSNIELDDVFRISTLLDPRFKKAGFSNLKNSDLAQIELVNLVERMLEEGSSNSNTNELSGRDSILESDYMDDFEEPERIGSDFTSKRRKIDGGSANK